MRTAYIIAAVVVVVLIIAVVLLNPKKPAATVITPNTQPEQPTAPTAPTGRMLTIPVVVTKQYFSPNNFTVRRGDTVTLRVSAPDLQHSVSIPQMNLHDTISQQQTVDLTFTVKASDVQVYCTDKCDPGVVLNIHVQ